MREPLWDRIKQWVCATFGHRPMRELWACKGHIHGVCPRCNRIVFMPESHP